jgi:hypothetical protein
MRYHFIGIKGSGMSALAMIMSDLGNEVQGSDVTHHLFKEDDLVNKGIKILPFDESNIESCGSGGLLIMYANNIVNNSKIASNGSIGVNKTAVASPGGSSGGGSTGIIFTTLNDLNNYLLDASRMSGMLATCLENEGVLYILSNDKSSWLTVETGITETFTYLFNSELW